MTTTIALRAPGQVTVKSVGLLADIGEHSAKRDLKPNPSAMNNSGPTLTQDLVHSLIQDQSRIKPDAVAVQFGTEVSLTYRQLNQLSNGVARQLVCGRGTIVPIATSRSVGMIVSLLAVLKTGAAYTLLSSDTPVDRSKLIIKDVGAPFVIVDETTEGSFNDSGEIKIEDLMSRAGISPPTLKEDLNIYQIPSDIAYVIFTSGTTGKPKGVLLSHGAAFTGLTALPPLDPKQPLRQLLCHSPNFSAAQRTIHGTLSRGGTLCITSKEKLTLQLRETIQQMDISSLEVTPSMLRLIKPSEIPGSIKKITLGGELTGPAIVDEWADKVELFTAYGLSECTMLNLRHRLMSGQDHQVIGKPSDSTTCYIMEPGTIRLVPDGETGELCLGGQQLAEGYLNLPEATARVFIANPFGSGRLYRTGDMAVANDSGIVRLIGRIDQQTKIDGQRVEPNESNSVLQLLPGVVSSCVVSAVVLGRKALVALVVAGNDRHWPVFVRELRASLQTQLPASSIPRYWIQQDTLPLNINGKVDVASLVKQVEIMDESGLITPPSLSPKSGTVQTDISDIFEHETVEVVASILSLSRSAIDLELSFQELGGGSLDAIVFASKLREKSIHISVSDVLQTTSLRELIKANQNFGTTPIMPPKPFSLLPSGVKLDVSELEDAYPVTPIQESVLADSLLGHANYTYQRVYELQGVSSSVVRSALESVIAQNSIFRATFQPLRRSFVQMIHPKASLPWESLTGMSLPAYLERSAKKEMPIDEPLIRAAVLDEKFLVVEMHHALFDFWSSQFIIADALTLLQGLSPMARLPFNIYVEHQQSAYNDQAKDFWRNYLSSAASTVVDIPKSDTIGKPFVLRGDLGDSLTRFAKDHAITAGTALHAAWALTLAKVVGSSDVTFMTAFSGRDTDINGILDLNGPTLCTVPLRVRLESSATVLEFTKGVQSNLWNLSKYASTGMRNALSLGAMQSSSFNSMVNLLVKLDEFPEDGLLKPVITHGDNFTQ
jgi:amino acid adenylation domain-containing protein